MTTDLRTLKCAELPSVAARTAPHTPPTTQLLQHPYSQRHLKTEKTERPAPSRFALVDLGSTRCEYKTKEY